MNGLFIALALILAGGVLPLLLGRQILLIRVVGAAGIGAGSLLGCLDAVSTLVDKAEYEASFNYLHTFNLSFQLNSLSAFFLLAIFAVSSLAALYSFHYMDDPHKARRCAGHYFFFSVLVIAMALVVTADGMVAFLISWELMTLSSFFLVIYDHEAEDNRRAGYQYFVFSHIGAMFIFAAFALVFANSGRLDFAAAHELSDSSKILVFVLALIGFGSKAGVFPLHFWLPHAHPAAPSHISAVMSGVMIKTGVFGVLKMVMVLQLGTPLFGQILVVVGVISGLLGVVYALGQRDIKRLLAYSSIENIGIIFIGLGIGLVGAAKGQPLMAMLGIGGGLLHMLNHALFKSLLFFGAGMVLHQTKTRVIEQLGGLLKGMKITGATFLIGSLAVAGLPPFNGFMSELLIYLGGFGGVSLDRSTLALCLLAIVGLAVIGGLALACFTRVVGVAFLGEPRSAAAQGVHEHGWTMLLAMMLTAAACVVIGVQPKYFVQLAMQVANSTGLTGGQVSISPALELANNISLVAAIVIGGVAALGLLRLALYQGKTVTRSGTWGCGYTQPTVRMQYTGSSYAASMLDFFKAVAPLREVHQAIRGRFPIRTSYSSSVEDMAENYAGKLIVRPLMALFDRLRWIQNGDLHLYIGYILLAIVILFVYVWRG